MRYLDLPFRNFPSCSLLLLQTANTPKVPPEKLWMKSPNSPRCFAFAKQTGGGGAVISLRRRKIFTDMRGLLKEFEN